MYVLICMYIPVRSKLLVYLDLHTYLYPMCCWDLFIRMDSFVLAETFKYLYLLFAEEEELAIQIDDYVFTTEAHILPLSLSRAQNVCMRTELRTRTYIHAYVHVYVWCVYVC